MKSMYLQYDFILICCNFILDGFSMKSMYLQYDFILNMLQFHTGEVSV